MVRKTLFAAVAIAGALVLWLRWKSDRDAPQRVRWDLAITAAVDTAREGGWIETFDAPTSLPLAEHDARWRPLFGRLLVDAELGAAIGDPEGGWERDGGDDYAFRPATGSYDDITIIVDGRWTGEGSFGAQGNVQAEPPHRLYEAALWRGKLALIYFVGPTPDRFEVLAESAERVQRAGHYRLVFCLNRRPTDWRLVAVLQDPDSGYATVARASATDRRLGPGGQGIGLLGGGGRRSSYVTGIAVRPVLRSDSVRNAPTPDDCG